MNDKRKYLIAEQLRDTGALKELLMMTLSAEEAEAVMIAVDEGLRNWRDELKHL